MVWPMKLLTDKYEYTLRNFCVLYTSTPVRYENVFSCLNQANISRFKTIEI